jgi:hypothetical protein
MSRRFFRRSGGRSRESVAFELALRGRGVNGVVWIVERSVESTDPATEGGWIRAWVNAQDWRDVGRPAESSARIERKRAGTCRYR